MTNLDREDFRVAFARLQAGQAGGSQLQAFSFMVRINECVVDW